MLKTVNDHEVSGFALMHGNGVRMWRAVSMELRIPYFLVCHAFKDGNAWLHETCLLWREADVVDFCKEVSSDANRKIVQLSMFLPDSEAGRWSLEELKEIWSEGDDNGPRSPIFVAYDGRHINHGERNASAIANAKEKIYSIPRSNRSSI